MKVLITIIGFAVGLSYSSTEALAQEKKDFGKEEFESKCASCHGLSGRGDGPLSGIFVTKPTDLTTLAKRNGGVFPAQRAYEIIDGRQNVAAHGPRVMPVWGKEYRAKVPDLEIEGYFDLRSTVAEAKVLALVDYLFRIQHNE